MAPVLTPAVLVSDGDQWGWKRKNGALGNFCGSVGFGTQITTGTQAGREEDSFFPCQASEGRASLVPWAQGGAQGG